MPGRFKDYIAMPKANGYQSLHTTIIGPGGKPLEIQIRTKDMHEVAEFGVAAHWAYKEGKTNGIELEDADQKIDIFREILELKDESDNAADFMESVKGDIFTDRVYVFTPKGDVYELPKGAVTLDFAYLVHTEVGNHAVGAKVNNKIVPLTYQLKNGDIVEMITQSNTKPSRDWINLVKTSRARNKIRKYFKSEGRLESIQKGQAEVEEQLEDLGYLPKDYLDKKHLADALQKFNFTTEEELFGAIGYGEVSTLQVVNRLLRDERELERQKKDQAKIDQIMSDQKTPPKTVAKNNNAIKVKHDDGVVIQGADNLLLRLAKCCNPLPGDDIVGYITRGRGVTIHRRDCKNINDDDRVNGRLIDVEWQDVNTAQESKTYQADIDIFGFNRSGLLNDILQVLNAQTTQIANIKGKVDNNDMVHIFATIAVKNSNHLDEILSRIKDVPNVYEVKRADN